MPASYNTAKIGCATESPGKRFKRLDAMLDKAATGPLWLNDPRVAVCVVNGIYTGQTVLNFYDLHAFAIMPNHVHLLISPNVSVPRLTNGLKGVTARNANLILDRTGKHFWQDESFDHWVRSPKEFDRIHTYIEFNANFAQYKTYAWEHVSTRDPLDVNRIKSAINEHSQFRNRPLRTILSGKIGKKRLK